MNNLVEISKDIDIVRERKKAVLKDIETDGMTRYVGVCLKDERVTNMNDCIKDTWICFDLHNTTNTSIFQCIEQLNACKVLFSHDTKSQKIDPKIVEIATELKRRNPKIELYQIDENAPVSAQNALLDQIKPFSLYEYKRGENTGFFDNGDGMSLKTYNDVDQEDIKSIEWYVKGILPKIGSVQLAAEPKAGKSIISEQLAYAFSYGLNFWNAKLPQCEVLLYDLEESVEDLNERLENFKAYYQPTTTPKNVYIRNAINQFVPREHGDLTIFDDLNDELFDHPHIKVIIIDNIKSTLLYSDNKSRSENKSEHDLLQKLNKWAGDNKILLLFTNHVTKETITPENPFKSIEGTNSMAGGPKINMVMCRDQLQKDKLILFGQSRICRPFEYDLFKKSFPRPTKNDADNEGIIFCLEEREEKKDYPINESVIQQCRKLLDENNGKKVKTTAGKITEQIKNYRGLSKNELTHRIKKLGGYLPIEDYSLSIFLTKNGTGGSTWNIEQLDQ